MTPDRRPAPRPATLEDVAARAGVSRATASRVLNDHPRVSEPTRRAVEAAVAELGYAPNRAARSLAAQRHDTVALVVSEPGARIFADPYFSGTIRGAAAALSESRYQLVLLMTQGEADRDRAERYLLRRNADGVLLISAHADDPLPLRLAEAGIPCVLSGRPPFDSRLTPPAHLAAEPPADGAAGLAALPGTTSARSPGASAGDPAGAVGAVGADEAATVSSATRQPPAGQAAGAAGPTGPGRPPPPGAGSTPEATIRDPGAGRPEGRLSGAPPTAPAGVAGDDIDAPEGEGAEGEPRPPGYVDADNVGGAHQAVTYLLVQGRTTVATVAGPPDMSPGIDRRTGWEHALHDAGLVADPTLVARGDFTRTGGEAAAAALLDRRPDIDAIFAASDLMALGVLDALRRRGRRVPEDVALVSFDDSELASIAVPPLTTVRQPIEQIGWHMADHLVAQLDRDAEPAGLILPTELIIRASA